MMKIRKHGRFTLGLQHSAVDCQLIVLLGWENKRLRIDFKRRELHDGWWRTVTKAKAWRIERDGMYTISHYYFRRIWVH